MSGVLVRILTFVSSAPRTMGSILLGIVPQEATTLGSPIIVHLAGVAAMPRP